jgi:hypothetical protein
MFHMIPRTSNDYLKNALYLDVALFSVVEV